jgi:hypothetical protein
MKPLSVGGKNCKAGSGSGPVYFVRVNIFCPEIEILISETNFELDN